MTRALITSQDFLFQHGQIFLNNFGDLVLCSKCKRVYVNDLDNQLAIDQIETHSFYGNQFINLMARSGRRDLVADCIKKEQEKHAKTAEQMKADYIKKLK